MRAVTGSAGMPKVADWLFAVLMAATGVANIVLVHAVPGLAYLAVSLLYVPPARALLERGLGFRLHGAFRVVLGIAVVMFTLGVSDLGDMLD